MTHSSGRLISYQLVLLQPIRASSAHQLLNKVKRSASTSTRSTRLTHLHMGGLSSVQSPPLSAGVQVYDVSHTQPTLDSQVEPTEVTLST